MLFWRATCQCFLHHLSIHSFYFETIEVLIFFFYESVLPSNSLFCLEYLGSTSLNSTALRYGSKRRIILVNFFHEWDYDGDVARSAKSDDYSLNNGTQSLESDWTFLSLNVLIHKSCTELSLIVQSTILFVF